MCHTLALKMVAKQLLQFSAEGTKQDLHHGFGRWCSSKACSRAVQGAMGRTGRGVLCDFTRGGQLSMPGGSSWNLSLNPPPQPPVCLVFPKLLLRIKLVVDVDDLGYFSEDSGFLASLSGLRVSLAACPPCFTGMPMPR